MDRDLALKIVFAAIGTGSIPEPWDDDPFAAAQRAADETVFPYDPAGLAREVGLDWPIRPEAFEMAWTAGMARWATAQRDEAIVAARRAGCTLRDAAGWVGLTHAGVARILNRAEP